MIDLSFFAGPAVGAVIGYITNDIAIRMLFKPYQAKYVLGMKVPFTPGIIPKEKDRIAGAIGKAISDNLMNRDVLERNLMSDDLLDKIRVAIDDFICRLRQSDDSVRELAGRYLTEEEMMAIHDNLTDEIGRIAATALNDKHVGQSIAHMACEHVIEKTRHSLAGKLGADHLVQLATAPVEKMLAHHINEVLSTKAQGMVNELVTGASDKLLEQPVRELLDGHEQQLEQMRESIVRLYCHVIGTRLPRILEAIDISHMVEQRIQEMDMDEAERIILDVMRKELRAIVWLGAFLGCLMGTITSLF